MAAQDVSSAETEQMFVEGTLLVRENEMARKLFILKEGKVRVFRDYLGQPVTLAILGPGDIFGELSFFDGEPRSASVEALTPVRAMVIEGDRGRQQIKQLPEWVWIILKTVFHRFREMDQKLTVYQSINDFRKKTFNIDTLGSTIFQELKRYNHSLDLVLSKALTTKKRLNIDSLFEEMDELLGNKFLGLRVYLQQLDDNRIIRQDAGQRDAYVTVDTQAFQLFDNYLKSAIDREDYFIFSHTSLAMIRRFLQVPDLEKMKVTSNIDRIMLDKIPLQDEAVEELTKRGILVEVSGRYCVTLQPKNLGILYTSQSIIKAFDRSRIALE